MIGRSPARSCEDLAAGSSWSGTSAVFTAGLGCSGKFVRHPLGPSIRRSKVLSFVTLLGFVWLGDSYLHISKVLTHYRH